jgi:hypothetical protein
VYVTSTHTLLRCDKNFVVVIGFEVLQSGKAENVAAVIERAAQHTLGKSVKEVINSTFSDGAALQVAQCKEVFPGAVNSDLCLNDESMKMGQSSVGELERTTMKVIQNEFVGGKMLYNMVHKLVAYFSYSDRLDSLWTYCDSSKCVKIRLKLDLNKTRVTAMHNLLLSVIRMKPGIVTYTAACTTTPKELLMTPMDYDDLVGFEAVLDITRIVTTLAQFEQHLLHSYRVLMKVLTMNQLREDYLWVIDVSKLSTNLGPRPTRRKVLKSEMSVRTLECWRRSELECERRWCSNCTEEINGSPLVNTDHDLLVTFLDFRTAGCPHLSKVEMPRLWKTVLKEYVKHGLNDFDCQTDAAETAAKVAAQVSKKQKTSPTSSRPTLSEKRPLSIGVSAGDTNADFGWESGSDDDDIPVMKTPKDRELREKALEVECTVVMKRWVQFAKEVDWSVFVGLKAVVVAPVVGGKSGE